MNSGSNNPQPNNKQFGLNSGSAASNEQATPLPYLAGLRRFAGTFITDAFDQVASTVSGGGKNSGKGGGGSGTNYYAGFACAFCLGPVDGIYGIFLNGDDVFTSNNRLVPTLLHQFQNLATADFSGPHNLADGSVVLINGADQTEFNGEFTIHVTGANSFQYTIPGSSLNQETATGQIQIYAKLAPILRGNEDSREITIPNYGTMVIHWGTETQTADNYLAVSGTNHSPMRGVCYAVFKQFFLGLNQTNIQNLEVVLSRKPSVPWQTNPTDNNISNEANPAIFIYELLTNPRAGVGLVADDFNLVDFAAAAVQFANEGLGISFVIDRADTALTVVQNILNGIDAMLLLDDAGKLTLQVIRAPADYTVIAQLTDAQLASRPQMKALDWSNAINQTRIVFPNRDAAFTNDFVEWFDFGSVTAALKLAQPQTLQRDFITRKDLAQAMVQAAGAASAIPAVSGQVDVLYTADLWAALAPGELFQGTFTSAPRANGIFRVTKRTFKRTDQPVFTIEYAADRSYLNFGS
ncbi:MAG: hypothetical protein P4N60_11265 [Verrucomicrobiae bacterium]|nr:hypothetical protein [Verrucomicrobiae bacterium]